MFIHHSSTYTLENDLCQTKRPFPMKHQVHHQCEKDRLEEKIMNQVSKSAIFVVPQEVHQVQLTLVQPTEFQSKILSFSYGSPT